MELQNRGGNERNRDSLCRSILRKIADAGCPLIPLATARRSV